MDVSISRPRELSSYFTIDPSLQSQYDAHVRKWQARPVLSKPSHTSGFHKSTVGCTSCDLCSKRRNVVLFRGTLPCDILFIGDTPGEEEDAIGVPFVGPIGQQLNAMIFAAYGSTPLQEGNCMEMSSAGRVGNSRGQLTYATTNILSCIPRHPDELGSGEIRQPSKEEVTACQPRLLEALALASPQRIVLLGKLTQRFFPKVINANLPRWDGQTHTLTHPSTIVNIQSEAPRDASLLEKKFVLALSSIIRSL